MLVFLVINISHMSKPIPMVPINGYNRAGTYLLKFNSRNTKKRCEKCSKLTMKTPDRRSGVFIVNFEHISRLVLVFLLLTLKMELPLATCHCQQNQKLPKTYQKSHNSEDVFILSLQILVNARVLFQDWDIFEAKFQEYS